MSARVFYLQHILFNLNNGRLMMNRLNPSTLTTQPSVHMPKKLFTAKRFVDTKNSAKLNG